MKSAFVIAVLSFALIEKSFGVDSEGAMSGVANINIRGTAQDQSFQQIRVNTNTVGGVTNFNYTLKFTTTNFLVDNDSLLDLLANSFNTNFPVGAKLVLRGGVGHYFFGVSDSTGTNIILDTTPVFDTSTHARVNSGLVKRSTTNNPSINFTGTDTESFTGAVIFQYDDTAMNTADGKHTVFFWSGLAESKALNSIANNFTTEHVTIHLTGGGQFPSPYLVVFNGTIHATLTGFEPFP